MRRQIPTLPTWMVALAECVSEEIRRPWAHAWPLTIDAVLTVARELGYTVRPVDGLNSGAGAGRVLLVPASHPLRTCPAAIHELAESLIRSGRIEIPMGAGPETPHLVACLVEEEYRGLLEAYLLALDQADRRRAERIRVRSLPAPALTYERDEWSEPVRARGRRK